MAESATQAEYRHRSPFTWLAIFWFAMSLPRLWYLLRADVFFIDPFAALKILQVGLLKDGILAGILLLVLQLVRRPLARFSARFYASVLLTLLRLVSLCLGVMFVNAEVLHQAGTQLEWQYLHLVGADRGLMLFLTTWSSVVILLLSLIAVPVAFYRICVNLRFIRFESFLGSLTGVLVSLSMIFGGIAATQAPLPDKSRSAAANNYVLWLVTRPARDADLSDPRAENIQRILDTAPLEKAGVKPQPWNFVDPDFPLVKATAYHLCQAGIWSGEACSRDNDGDGVPVSADCNDWDARIHPGAPDVPRDGIDSDCSGVDADPPNVIYIHMESARAANFGSFDGFKHPSTPRFDKLAKDGVLFTNAYCNGIQTRYALAPMYCSTLDRLSTKWICLHNPKTELLSVPGILRGRGYHTIYVHGGDNNFSSHSARLWQWFEDIYDKGRPPFKEAKRFNWGLTDKDLFNITYDLMKNRKDKRPFFLAVATLSLHFPMGLPDPRFQILPGKTYDENVSNIIRYADDALGDFIERIQRDPQFENTIFIVAADHGIKGMEQSVLDNGSVPTVLDEEIVWIPIALIGKGWNMAPGKIGEVRQQADIGPTILDRLGIEVPNPFIGQSLLRRFGDRKSAAYFSTANNGAAAGVRRENWRYWVRFGSGNHYLYDVERDREGKNNLAGDPRYAELIESLYKDVRQVWSENNALIQENRIWNWKYWTRNP